MRSLALVAAGVIAAFGLAALVIPDTLIATGRYIVSPVAVYAATALRVGIGIVFMLAARESRAPWLLGAFGVVAFVSGLASLLSGVEGVRARLDWEAANVTILRVEGAAAVFLGALIFSLFRRAVPPVVTGR